VLRVLLIAVSVGQVAPLAAQEPASSTPAPSAEARAADATAPAAFVETIPRTSVSIEMRPVGDGLWVSAREITWNAYDVFVFELDRPFGEAADDDAADAVLRPSKPYGLADYGFGRDGYPVISVSHQGAAAFCAWLSGVTGERYRLPTEAEWDALAAREGPAWLASERRRALREHAQLAPAARQRTHPVGSLPADALGLHDLFGNVAEWCTAADGSPVLKGGSFQTDVDAFALDWRALPTPAWNQRDPQIPKSPWWLSDAPFAGFRVVCELARDGEAAPADTTPPSNAAPADAPPPPDSPPPPAPAPPEAPR